MLGQLMMNIFDKIKQKFKDRREFQLIKRI